MRAFHHGSPWAVLAVAAGLALLASAPAAAQTLDLRDDFSGYQEGAEPAGPWLADGFLWEVTAGAVRAMCPGVSHLNLRQPQWFRRALVEATVTVRRPVTKGWKVVGVALFHDDEHMWHAALIESPDDNGSHRHFELGMRLPGSWPAQDGLTRTVDFNTAVDWQYDHPYRITMGLGDGKMRALLAEMDGTRVSEIAYDLADPAVMDGSPALRCAGFEAVFDDVVVQATDYAGAPPPEEERLAPPLDIPSIAQVQGKQTGFFHVERTDGVWWVIEPGGKGYYAIGTDHVRYGGHWCQTLGYAPYGKNTQRLYPSEDAWAETATDRLKRWNFNLLPAGHSPSCRYRGMPHTEFLSFGSGYAGYDPLVEKVNWTGFPNVFSKAWEAWCDKVAWRDCQRNAGDPWLFGYFLDNELEWWGKGGGDVGLAMEAMKLPAGNSAKQALVGILRARYGDIARLNQAWGAKYESWDQLAQADKLEAQNADALRTDQLAYVAQVADRYFRVTCEAIRRYDPNHMVLGSRFAGDAPPGVWEAAGRYCDIVTFNYYGRVDTILAEAPGTQETWTGYYEKAQRPLMITEWSFPALDSGLPCENGAGMRVDTQQQKALCYEVYQRLIFSLPFMVGSDYFMWVDEPALGIADTFPEDSNYGLVNEQDEPYEVLTRTATRVNALAYELHSGQVPEVSVRRVALRDGKIQAELANDGRGNARFDLSFVVGGREAERAPLRLAPGEHRWVPMTQQVAPPAYVTALADPGRELPEQDRTDNHASFLYYRPAAWPQCPAGKWLARWPVVVTTGPVSRPDDAVITVSGEMLADLGTAEEVGWRLAAYDGDGTSLPCQLEPWPEGWQVALSVAGGPPRSGLVIYLYLTDADLPQRPPSVVVVMEGNRWRADNGVLTLEGTEGGNVVDSVTYLGTAMGRLNPLIWERRAGQDLWTQTVRTSQVLAFSGPVRAAIQVWCESEPEQPSITAVDDQGAMAAQRARPHHFQVVHRVGLAPGRSSFGDQFVSVRNLGRDPMELRGWFTYLLSAIGGDSNDDVVGGPKVPNYWLNVGAWRDEPTGLTLGAVPTPDDRIACYFWRDPAGGQHADLRRAYEPSAFLEPQKERREEPEAPPALIFAGRSDDRPWAGVGTEALAAGYGEVRALGLERP